MSFSYAFPFMNEYSAGGGDFTEQLSPLILSKNVFSHLTLLS